MPEYDDDNLREVLIGSYRMVYSLDESTVRIVVIFHGARLIQNVIDDQDHK